MQVWSYFEDHVMRQIIVQFKFNMDALFSSYSFLEKNSDLYHVGDITIFYLLLHVCITYLRLCVNT